MSSEDLLRARLNTQIIANIGELEHLAAKTEQAGQLRQQAREAQAAEVATANATNTNLKNKLENQQNLIFKNKKLQKEIEEKENLNKKLSDELSFYKDLLAKPMHEIANNNSDFKQAYEIQQELLATWMVSQRAFKELAMDFGINAGHKKEDIELLADKTKIKVLDNQTVHDNNLGNHPYIEPYKEIIKSKVKK